MLKLAGVAVVVCAAASAAGIPTPKTISGTYVEARTADVYTGPCFANGEVEQLGRNAVFGWKVNSGEWQGVDLSGLSVVGVVQARHTLGDVYETAYPVKSVLIVDSRAGAEQRLALQNFARTMAGDLLQDVVRVDYQPIRITVKDNNVHTTTATLTAGNEATIVTRALNDSDHICHNEDVYYPPLVKVSHAMPAYAVANSFQGAGLGTKWQSPFRRSAFVGSFETVSR